MRRLIGDTGDSLIYARGKLIIRLQYAYSISLDSLNGNWDHRYIRQCISSITSSGQSITITATTTAFTISQGIQIESSVSYQYTVNNTRPGNDRLATSVN